jgi:uncharacterized protein YdiU (UPF0061 family)
MNIANLHLKSPYLLLDGECFDLVSPMPLKKPYLLSFNPQVASLVGLEESEGDPLLVELLNGTFTPKGLQTFATCYAGHQFGNYAPRLGDGRVIHYGKINDWNLQTKGSGETLYARSDDGRATISSSIREYLMSEAMHHLGIPTMRSLAIIGSETLLLRQRVEKGGVVMRLAPSWIRFGTFEYFSHLKRYDTLRQLLEYAIEESYPHLKGAKGRYEKFFEEVTRATAQLVAKWQGVGFCHGVLNTDNMSIAGVTIDYGPFAMLDLFDFGFVPNASDKAGRYAYKEQPNVVYWNLTKLAQALSCVVDREQMQRTLDAYGESIYPNAYIEVMRQKLGLVMRLEEDRDVIIKLIGTLQDAMIDYTQFFRHLSRYDGDREPIFALAMNPIPLEEWLSLYDRRLAKEPQAHSTRHASMLGINPKYVLKNYMLQEAIDEAKEGNFEGVATLLKIAQNPFSELEAHQRYAKDTPEGYENLTIACTS